MRILTAQGTLAVLGHQQDSSPCLPPSCLLRDHAPKRWDSRTLSLHVTGLKKGGKSLRNETAEKGSHQRQGLDGQRYRAPLFGV